MGFLAGLGLGLGLFAASFGLGSGPVSPQAGLSLDQKGLPQAVIRLADQGYLVLG